MTKCNPSVIAPPHFRHCEATPKQSIILHKAIFAMESLNQLKRILNFFIRGQGVLLAKRPPYPLKPPTPSTLHLHYCAYPFRHCPPPSLPPLPSLRDSACGIVAIHNLAYFAFHHLVIALPPFRHCEATPKQSITLSFFKRFYCGLLGLPLFIDCFVICFAHSSQ